MENRIVEISFLLILLSSNSLGKVNGSKPLYFRANRRTQPQKVDPKCLLNEPVCAEGVRTAVRPKITFQNQCRLDEHNQRYTPGSFPNWVKIRDGPCDCGPCEKNFAPVCMVVDEGATKGFLNQCFVDRYRCLHGLLSVGFKYRDGRCQKCVAESSQRLFYIEGDPYEKVRSDYIRRNKSWQTDYGKVCTDDMTSPLIEE